MGNFSDWLKYKNPEIFQEMNWDQHLNRTYDTRAGVAGNQPGWFKRAYNWAGKTSGLGFGKQMYKQASEEGSQEMSVMEDTWKQLQNKVRDWVDINAGWGDFNRIMHSIASGHVDVNTLENFTSKILGVNRNYRLEQNKHPLSALFKPKDLNNSLILPIESKIDYETRLPIKAKYNPDFVGTKWHPRTKSGEKLAKSAIQNNMYYPLAWLREIMSISRLHVRNYSEVHEKMDQSFWGMEYYGDLLNQNYINYSFKQTHDKSSTSSSVPTKIPKTPTTAASNLNTILRHPTVHPHGINYRIMNNYDVTKLRALAHEISDFTTNDKKRLLIWLEFLKRGIKDLSKSEITKFAQTEVDASGKKIYNFLIDRKDPMYVNYPRTLRNINYYYNRLR